MIRPPATQSKDKLENCRVGSNVHGYHGSGWEVHGMDTMVQLLKESLRSSKEEFRGLGSNCWCAPHTPSAVPPSICVTARDTSRLICGSQGLQRWTLIVQGYLFGHNCTRISVETIVRAKATTVQWVQGRVVAGFSRSRWMAAHLMEVEVLRMLRYCRMSGTVISRKARKNRSPEKKLSTLM